MNIFSLKDVFTAAVQSQAMPSAVNLPTIPSMGSEQLPHMTRGIIPYQNFSYFLWFLISVFLFIAAYFIYTILAKRSHKKNLVNKSLSKEEQIACFLEQIKVLEPSLPFHRKKQQDFFYHLSFYFRSCIEISTAIKATDLTFNELKKPLRAKLQMEKEEVAKILDFLKFSDIIKFSETQTNVEKAHKSKSEVLIWAKALENKLLSAIQEQKIKNSSVDKRGHLSTT